MKLLASNIFFIILYCYILWWKAVRGLRRNQNYCKSSKFLQNYTSFKAETTAWCIQIHAFICRICTDLSNYKFCYAKDFTLYTTLFSFKLEHEIQMYCSIINWMTVHAIYYNQISTFDWKQTSLAYNHIWKNVKMKERCPHETIYSWLKHSWLKPRQYFETEIRWVNGKKTSA